MSGQARRAMPPKRVRHPAGCSFASRCSPPRIAATQLPSATCGTTSHRTDSHPPDKATSQTHPPRQSRGNSQDIGVTPNGGLRPPYWGPEKRSVTRPDFGPLFRIRKFRMPRRRKRGRPRTGSKPVVPVRLATKQLKKIAKLAELKGVNRSTVLRELIDLGLDSGPVLLLLRRPGTKGRTAVDRVIRVMAANERVKLAQ